MAKTPVTGSSPIEFTEDGRQIVIPLSEFYLDAHGVLTSNSDLYQQATAKAAVDAWLKQLLKTGAVQAATLPPPAPAMVITAARPGSAGNNINAVFSNVRQDAVANAVVFDAEVTESETYAGLTKDTVKDVLGTAPGPGLVYVSSAGQPAQPANNRFPLAGPAGGPYTADIVDGGGNPAFTVTSRANDAEASNTVVVITGAADPAHPDTFTLTATWSKPKQVGIQPGGLQGAFAYEITVAAPPGGQLGVPAEGTVTLRGGTDAAAPTAAKATVYAGQ